MLFSLFFVVYTWKPPTRSEAADIHSDLFTRTGAHNFPRGFEELSNLSVGNYFCVHQPLSTLICELRERCDPVYIGDKVNLYTVICPLAMNYHANWRFIDEEIFIRTILCYINICKLIKIVHFLSIDFPLSLEKIHRKSDSDLNIEISETVPMAKNQN